MKALLIAGMIAGSVIAAGPAANATEMIYNGGFDSGTSGWDLQTWGTGNSVTETTENVGAPYNNVLRCDVSALPTPGTALVGQHVTLIKGHTYQFAIDVNTATSVNLQLIMRNNDAGANYAVTSADTVQGTGGWQHYVLKGGFDRNVSDAFVAFMINTTGTIRVDNVSLTDISPASPSLLNTSVIPSTYFGMHINDFFDMGYVWPQVNQGMLRLWDCGVYWSEVEPTSGSYNWGAMDSYVNAAVANNNQVMYTLGLAPSWAAYGNTDQYAVPDPYSWQDYVYNVALHNGSKVKYYEMWNEVNYMYHGDPASMAYLTLLARQQLDRVDPSIVLIAPSVTDGGVGWMDSYLTALKGFETANPTYAPLIDGIAWHHYFDETPEDDLALIAGVQSTASNHGYGALPIYETEGSYDPIGASNNDLFEGAVAREFLTQWSQGITNFNYYTWDIHTPLNTSAHTSTPNVGGVAYREVAKWLTGAQMSWLAVDGVGTWQIGITRPGGYSGRVVWQGANGSWSARVWDFDSTISQYRTLEATTTAVNTSTNFTLGPKPLLFENQPVDPAGVTATQGAVGSHAITVTWKASVGTGYKIYRSTSATGTYTQVGTTTTALTFTNTGLTAGTTYYYKVAAYNATRTGAQSAAAHAAAR